MCGEKGRGGNGWWLAGDCFALGGWVGVPRGGAQWGLTVRRPREITPVNLRVATTFDMGN